MELGFKQEDRNSGGIFMYTIMFLGVLLEFLDLEFFKVVYKLFIYFYILEMLLWEEFLFCNKKDLSDIWKRIEVRTEAFLLFRLLRGSKLVAMVMVSHSQVKVTSL